MTSEKDQPEGPTGRAPPTGAVNARLSQRPETSGGALERGAAPNRHGEGLARRLQMLSLRTGPQAASGHCPSAIPAEAQGRAGFILKKQIFEWDFCLLTEPQQDSQEVHTVLRILSAKHCQLLLKGIETI